MARRRHLGSSGATVEDLYAHRGKIQRYKLTVPPAHGYGRFVAYFATKKHASQTAKNLRNAGYRPKVMALVPESVEILARDRSWIRRSSRKASLRAR
jgi:hypothetical protein